MRSLSRFVLLVAFSIQASAADGPWIEGLGLVESGTVSLATKMSTNAGVVVGTAYTNGNQFASQRPIIWTRAGGTQLVAVDAGYDAVRFTGISGDGSVAVGQSRNSSLEWRGFLSTASNSFQPLIETRYPAGITRDGQIVFGQADIDGTRAVTWTLSGGFVTFDTPFTYGSTIEAASSNGSILVGSRFDASYNEKAVFWTSSNVRTDLGTLAGGLRSSAIGVSGDGSIIAGWSESANGNRAFRWTQATGMVTLGTLAGYDASQATAISENGEFIVGTSYDSSTFQGEAFIWSSTSGMVSLASYLIDGGVDLTGWTIGSVSDVSSDGTYFVGTGSFSNVTQGYVAHITAAPIPEPSTYGLILGGLALVGAAIRRRRK